MKKLLYLLIFAGVCYSEELPLTEQKVELLKLKREKILQDIDFEKNSWISPLTIWTSINNAKDTLGSDSKTKSAGVDLSQDVFRSGAIEYSIEKAEALGKTNMLGVDIEESNYLKRLYTLLCQIRRDTLKLKQSELILKNRDIDLFIIKEKYKAGSTDITEFNRAGIDKKHSQSDVIAAKNTLQNETHELKKIIKNGNIDSIKVPDVELISKDEYLKNHLELLRYEAKDESEEAAWKVTRSSYLPKLTLNASYGYSDAKSDIYNKNGDNYRYGAMLSMPLSINYKSAIESDYLQMLQTKTTYLDQKLELEQEYDMRVESIVSYNEKTKIADEMLKLYNDLYSFTQSQVNAGYKSSFELESLRNSVEIEKLEKEMQHYNILIEKISLYFDTKR